MGALHKAMCFLDILVRDSRITFANLAINLSTVSNQDRFLAPSRIVYIFSRGYVYV